MPLVFLISVIYYTVAKILQIVFFSLLPWMVCGINHIELKYNQIFKIAVFALTLPFVVASIVELFGLKVRFFSMLFVFIYAVYLVRAALACKEEIKIEGAE